MNKDFKLNRLLFLLIVAIMVSSCQSNKYRSLYLEKYQWVSFTDTLGEAILPKNFSYQIQFLDKRFLKIGLRYIGNNMHGYCSPSGDNTECYKTTKCWINTKEGTLKISSPIYKFLAILSPLESRANSCLYNFLEYENKFLFINDTLEITSGKQKLYWVKIK